MVLFFQKEPADGLEPGISESAVRHSTICAISRPSCFVLYKVLDVNPFVPFIQHKYANSFPNICFLF